MKLPDFSQDPKLNQLKQQMITINQDMDTMTEQEELQVTNDLHQIRNQNIENLSMELATIAIDQLSKLFTPDCQPVKYDDQGIIIGFSDQVREHFDQIVSSFEKEIKETNL